MNGLEEIQEIIKNFIDERQQVKKQIAEIEAERTQLAQERNEKKKANVYGDLAIISELGKQISKLGNQSQELQNKLDSKFNEEKTQINSKIDNLIAEGIRRIRKIEEEREDLGYKIKLQEERSLKYEIQKQEFYERFGRVPELSENAIKEDEIQDKECLENKKKIQKIEEQLANIETEITELARIKREFKNGDWAKILNLQENVKEYDAQIEEESITLPLMSEEINVEELQVEEFGPVEEMNVEEINVEEFEPLEEIQVEEFNSAEEKIGPIREFKTFGVENDEEDSQIDEIEEMARAIIEEIVAEQTKELNINKSEQQEEKVEIQEIEEKHEDEEEIITFEENEKEEPKIQIPLFTQRVALSSIIAKIENGEIVYKAQISNGDEIKIYPTKLETGNLLLKYKESRNMIKEILINYAVSDYKTLDKKVINKVDPIICELLIAYSKKYNMDAQRLIYNYAMSFSRTDECELYLVPEIVYNLAYIDEANLNKKEKSILLKICKNANKNEKINMIGCISKFEKIKYALKRLISVNAQKSLPEGKY